MPKRNTEPKIAQRARLIISREVFISNLKDRIEEGKKLLMIKVTPLMNNSFGGYNGFGSYRQARPEYVKEEYDTFYQAYRKWTDYNAELLKQSFDIPNNEYHSSYVSSGQSFIITGNEDLFEEHRDEINSKINNLESLIEKSPLIPSNVDVANIIESPKQTIDKGKVFIVHGHGESLKTDVARTLERLGLNAIILHEQEDYGRTIIEKFEAETASIGFAVILLTADDEGVSKRDIDRSKKEADFKAIYKSRARQNVVFEMGYFVGKLDRAHVFLLLEEGVEKPGDLDGIIYTPVDNEGMWRIKLAKRLKSVGYEVNINNII